MTHPLHALTSKTHLQPCTHPFQDHAGRRIAFISGNLTDDCTLYLADIELDWQNPSDFGDVADYTRRMINERLMQAAVRPKPGQTVQVAVHHLLTSTISLHSRVHSEVAGNVTFIDTLHALAFKAITRLKADTGTPAFNGVHLRIEDDFSHVKDAGAGCFLRAQFYLVFADMWLNWLVMHDADRQGLLPIYTDAFHRAQLNLSLPIYVACGIFETQPHFAWDWQTSLASNSVHKGQLLGDAELSALTSEQKAAVDFLVLVQAERFVGVQISSFSFFAAEYRKMHGIAPEYNYLIKLKDVPYPNDMFVPTNSVI